MTKLEKQQLIIIIGGIFPGWKLSQETKKAFIFEDLAGYCLQIRISKDSVSEVFDYNFDNARLFQVAPGQVRDVVISGEITYLE